MRVRIVVCLSLLASGLWVGCNTLEIRSDFDPEADFSRLRTWTWLEPAPAPGATDPSAAVSPFVEKCVRAAVEAALAAKGYPRDDAQPTFAVGYHLAVRDEIDVHEMNDYYGYGSGWGRHYGYQRGWGWGPGGPGSHTYVYEYQKGSLTLDVVLPEDRRLIWRGSAEAEVQPDSSPEQSEARIRRAVERILERFPPPTRTGSEGG